MQYVLTMLRYLPSSNCLPRSEKSNHGRWMGRGRGEEGERSRRGGTGEGSGREEIDDMVWLLTEQMVTIFKCCQINQMESPSKSNCLKSSISKSSYSAPSPFPYRELWVRALRFWNRIREILKCVAVGTVPNLMICMMADLWNKNGTSHHITNKWKWIVERNNFDKWLMCFNIFKSHICFSFVFT